MSEKIEILSPLISIGFELIFYIFLLVFTIYSVFLVYHWFSYGINKNTAMIALAVYLLVSAPLIIVMSISF